MITTKTNIYDTKWVDMVFEDRNKEYGAFELRKKSSHYTSLAIILAIAFFGLTISAPMIVNYLKGFVPEDVPEVKITEVNTLDEPPPVDEKEPPPPETPPPPPLKSTIQYVPPVIVPSEEVTEEQTPPIQEETEKTTVSTETNKGTEDGIDPSLLEKPPGDGVVGGQEEEPVMFAEQMPEFPGGEKAMMDFIYKNIQYPPQAKENNIQGKVTITFVVNRDGDVTDVKAAGKNKLGWGLEDEAIRVVKLLPNWKPGKQNGKTVRVKCSIPIKYSLE